MSVRPKPWTMISAAPERRCRRRPADPSPRGRPPDERRPRRSAGSAGPRASLPGSGPVRTTVTSLGALAATLRRAIAAYDSLVEMTWSAVRNVCLSRNSRPYVGRDRAVREARVVELGAQVVVVEHEPRSRRAGARPRASDQKMSGGLHAWMTSNGPRRLALSARRAVWPQRVRVLDEEARRRCRPGRTAGTSGSRRRRPRGGAQSPCPRGRRR